MFSSTLNYLEMAGMGDNIQSNIYSSTTGVSSQCFGERSDVISNKQSVSFDVSRMLSDERSVRPYSTEHFLSFRYLDAAQVQQTISTEATTLQTPKTKLIQDSDVEKRPCVTPENSDTSLISLTSSPASPPTTSIETPPTRSASSSPDSGCATSPDTDNGPTRKQARTNYTPAQIRALEKIFFDNPYPDSEHMETISKDLGVPENKIKIWFQNKRARWRRRVAASKNNTSPQQHMLSAVPSTPPQFNPYGYMAYHSPVMTSQYLPGYYPGSYPSTSNYGLAGMFTPQTKEPAFTIPQWQHYQRNNLFSVENNHLTSQNKLMTSFSKPDTPSVYRTPLQSNGYMDVTR